MASGIIFRQLDAKCRLLCRCRLSEPLVFICDRSCEQDNDGTVMGFLHVRNVTTQGNHEPGNNFLSCVLHPVHCAVWEGVFFFFFSLCFLFLHYSTKHSGSFSPVLWFSSLSLGILFRANECLLLYSEHNGVTFICHSLCHTCHLMHECHNSALSPQTLGRTWGTDPGILHVMQHLIMI